MSKRFNTSGSSNNNTLLNYFARSPANQKKLPRTTTDENAAAKDPGAEKENATSVHVVKQELKPVVAQAGKRKLEMERKPKGITGDDEVAGAEKNGNGAVSQLQKAKRARLIHSDEEEQEFKKPPATATTKTAKSPSEKKHNKSNEAKKKSVKDHMAPMEIDDDEEYEEEEDEDFSDGSDEDFKGSDFSASDSEYEEEEEEEEDSIVAEEDESSFSSVENKKTAKRNAPKKRAAARNAILSEKKPSNNNNNQDRETDSSAPALKGKGFAEKLASIQKMAHEGESHKNSDKVERIVTSASSLDEPVVWPHQKLDFLKPENIKDKDGRRPDHPDYDASTLYVPQKFLDSLSPGVRQWWCQKSENFDCVLFFKVGKFYELYHMDADVGVNELGFTYMRGEFAHSGFPEISFDKMSSILVDRGYKVARVEQTETPDMMTERCKRIKATKFDKVVRREICQITNRGTQVFGSQCQVTPNHQPNYMLAIVEKPIEPAKVHSAYGVCYIDTSIGDFYVGEFEDDKNCSRLLTLLSHHCPVLVVAERRSLSSRTQDILRTVLSDAIKEFLPCTASHICSAEKTLKLLAEGYYAAADTWPSVLRLMQDDSDHLGLTPRPEYKLALKAMGQCIAYMRKCHLVEKVLPMARYHLYTPPDKEASQEEAAKDKKPLTRRSHMVLDATTLMNLRVLGEEHSLLSTLDQCCTKFGKRLLHHWLCAPSCDLSIIRDRQRAVEELMLNPEILQQLRALLAPLPDFERHVAQIHLFSNKTIMENHPDGRAILFEEKLYNKKKIQNFIAILRGFESLKSLPQILSSCNSPLLKRLSQHEDKGGILPYLQDALDYFKNAFNHAEAAKTGVIAPEKGADLEYDNAQESIAEIKKELEEYLKEQEKYFGCRLAYFGSDKKRFQLEVPESHAHKAGKEYALESQAKGKKPVRRFSTQETKTLLKRMQQSEDQRNMVLRDIARRIFEQFSRRYEKWKTCTDCVANLDVLASLAEYARLQSQICVPELREPGAADEGNVSSNFINLEEGYHPCVNTATFIPNSIILGSNDFAALSILTGPNMGGKSTLMRQVGLLVIMAQIGALVPAQSLSLTLVDRIFTRLGAQDDIIAGHSTFLVEMSETSLILKHATRSSLVLLDELGRGTATYDGTAIAASVINWLRDLGCRTIFSTHYHNIIEFFNNDKRINLGHMACMVENEDSDDPTQETVTFLYKYSEGACPKSYGFNAAKLAGMPRPIIKRAYELSKRVEAIALKRKIASKIVAAAGGKVEIDQLKNLLLQLKTCQI